MIFLEGTMTISKIEKEQISNSVEQLSNLNRIMITPFGNKTVKSDMSSQATSKSHV